MKEQNSVKVVFGAMEEQIKHFILQLYFARNNAKTYNKVLRDMRKAHDKEYLQKVIDTIRERMQQNGLAFVAPATDNEAFRQQVTLALDFLEKMP